jgi:hypothetical protein
MNSNTNRKNLELNDFQPWLADRLLRWQRFITDPKPGNILVNMATWDMNLKVDIEGNTPLESWDSPSYCTAYADYQTAYLKAEIELTKHIDDDRLPMLNPGIGIALNSLYFADGKMDVSAGTTWRHPVINEWDNLNNLHLDPENPWFQGITAMNQRYLTAFDGDYCVQTFSHFGPMDMANALRGNDLFTDFYDSPDEVHQLMKKTVEATLWLENEQRNIVPMINGGTAIWGTWMPGNAVFMSEDATDLCAPAIFREFGKPYTEQISTAGGGCWIHHHAKGLHVHDEIAKVDGLRMTELSWDPNCPRPIDNLEKLFAQNNGIPLMTRCTPRDIYEKIDIMKQGRLILMLSAASLDEAVDAITFLRKHTSKREY